MTKGVSRYIIASCWKCDGHCNGWRWARSSTLMIFKFRSLKKVIFKINILRSFHGFWNKNSALFFIDDFIEAYSQTSTNTSREWKGLQSQLLTRRFPLLLSLHPSLVFLFNLSPSTNHLTRFSYYIFSIFLAIFILSSNNNNHQTLREQSKTSRAGGGSNIILFAYVLF